MPHHPSTATSASSPEAQTPDTAPQLIALAVSLVGNHSEVMKQIRCSDEDFVSYCSGEKELPSSKLDLLVSLIIDEQGKGHRQARRVVKATRNRTSVAG